MSKRAEIAAIKVYPEKWFRDIDGDCYDCNRTEREAYMEGYELAEKETIERAWEWMTSAKGEHTFEDFRKAMEEN